VVEADPTLRRAIHRTLLAEGLDPHGLASLNEVSRALQESDYDILLLDEDSGPTNILEMVQHLRSDGFTGPIVLTVALFDSAEQRYAASEAGVTELLRKPLSCETLQAAMDRISGAQEGSQLPEASAHRSSSRSNLFLAAVLMAVLGAAMAATTFLLSL